MNKCKFILCMCVALAFSGCGSRNKDVMSGKEENVVTTISQFPKTYQHEGENVTFDTQIVIDNQGNQDKVYSGKAKLQPIEYLKLESLLLGNVKKKEYKEELNNYFGDKYVSYDYMTDDNRVFTTGFHNAYYNTPFVKYVNASFQPLEENELYNADLYSTEKELSGFSRQKAFQQLKDLLKEINCEIPDEYICYSLDHETMSKEERWEDEDGNEVLEDKKDEWTQEDDSYYFALRQRVCGLPTFHPLYYEETYDNIQNMPIQALISRRGIEELQIERLFTYEMDEEPEELMSFEEIAESIEYNLSQVIGMNPFLVTEAKLCYYEQLTGKDEYRVIPVWLISHEQELDGAIYHYLSIYDAVTGKEIST